MKIRIVQNHTPDDMNVGGFDMLVEMPDGGYACFAEVSDFGLVLALLQNATERQVVRNVCMSLVDILLGWSATNEQDVLSAFDITDEQWGNLFLRFMSNLPEERVRPKHEHEAWQLQKSPDGGFYCAACGEKVDSDLSRELLVRAEAERLRSTNDPFCLHCGWEFTHVRHHDPSLYNYHVFEGPLGPVTR